MSTEASLLIALATFLAGFGIAWLIVNRKQQDRNYQHAVYLYEQAKSYFDQNDWTMALVSLAEAKAYWETHEICNLMALAFEKLNRFDDAAYYYDRVISPNFERKSNYQTYYYYRSALAYSKAGNWEFAFIRSNTAITSVQQGAFPRYIQDADYEDELRAIRMVSILHHFHGTQAFELARPDIDWILSNSNSKFRSLASSLQEVNKSIPLIAKEFDKLTIDPIIESIHRN